VLDWHHAIFGAVQDQSRNSNRRQDRTNIDLVVHAQYSHCRAEAGGLPLKARPPFTRGCIIGERLRECAQ
jgi:hypothetical protein